MHILTHHTLKEVCRLTQALRQVDVTAFFHRLHPLSHWKIIQTKNDYLSITYILSLPYNWSFKPNEIVYMYFSTLNTNLNLTGITESYQFWILYHFFHYYYYYLVLKILVVLFYFLQHSNFLEKIYIYQKNSGYQNDLLHRNQLSKKEIPERQYVHSSVSTTLAFS